MTDISMRMSQGDRFLDSHAGVSQGTCPPDSFEDWIYGRNYDTLISRKSHRTNSLTHKMFENQDFIKAENKVKTMMYKFMTLDDGTEVVHSDPYEQNGIETVKVYFEKPVHGDFESAECYLPTYEWKNIDGFSEDKIAYFSEYLKSVAHIIIRLAREGGFANASNF